jgi:hypothetical protein
VQLAENPPVVTVLVPSTSTFTQGQQGASFTVTVNNTGPGSTGDPTLGSDPMTVTDTLNSAFTYANFSGTGWSCSASAQTVTCTNDSAVVDGNEYPELTIDVNVSNTASGSISNSATVHGAGVASTNSNTDTITILAATTTSAANQTTTYSPNDQSVTLSATVTANSGTVNSGTVTFAVFNGPTQIGSSATSGTVTGGNASASYTLPGGTGAGTYTITATYNPGSGYAGSSDSSHTLQVNAITPTITWTPVTTVIFGDAGANVLNASVNCTSCGTIAYSTVIGGTPTAITSTTGLVAGNYTSTATFNPNPGYNTTSATSPLTVSGESVWIVDGGGGTSELAGNGYGITSSAYTGANLAVAIDNVGNVWSAGTGASLLVETSQVGTHPNTIASGTGGLDAPAGIAIDGASQVWVTNGNSSVSLFTDAGAPLSPSGGFTDPSLSTPSGVAVDLGGSVWIANTGNNSVTRILGAAVPVAPLATAAKNNTTGAKP